MEQLRKDNMVRLEFSSGLTLDGIAVEVEKDKANILLEDTSSQNAKRLSGAESINVFAYTPFGIRTMKSHIIEIAPDYSSIVISNPPADRVVQKREYLRIMLPFDFNVIKAGKTVNVSCVNLSAGSIAFRSKSVGFSSKEKVKVVLPASIFEKELVCNGHIQRFQGNYYVVQYDYLNKATENIIAKKIFSILDDILK